MASAALTRKQKALIKELRALTDELGLSFEDIERYETPEERTIHLERIKTHLIRGEVITQYTLVDDLLTHELAVEALGGRRAKPWQRKKTKFERFKQVLADNRASLRQKLGLYQSYRRVPPRIREIILALNATRNGFAHSFLVEDRTRPVRYRGQNIMDLAVFKRYLNDQQQVFDFLISRLL